MSVQHIAQEDLALYAMQFFSKEEATPIRTHVEHCSECRRELAEVQGDLAVYAHTADMHSPPALARERMLKQISREKKVRSTDRAPVFSAASQPGYGAGIEDPRESKEGGRVLGLVEGGRLTADDLPQRRHGLPERLLPWAGWAVAAGLAVMAGELYHQRDVLQRAVASDRGEMARVSADAAAARQLMDALNDPTAIRVTLTRSHATPAPQGKATYLPEKGALLFLASNMEPLNPYKVYELWLIPADGRDPVAAGTFRPDDRGNASLVMPELPKAVQAKAFGITIEDEGGSLTPTMPIILAGS